MRYDSRTFAEDINRHIQAKEKALLWIGVAIGYSSGLVTAVMLFLIYVVAKS